MRRSVRLVIAIGSCVATTLTGAAPGAGAEEPRATACGAWRRVHVLRPEALLTDVAVVSRTDAWAVGALFADTFTDPSSQPVTVRWDGARWNPVPFPAPARRSEALNAVAFATTGDGWVVGSSRRGDRGRGLSGRWDGAAWRREPVPLGSRTELNGLALDPRGRPMAVGYRYRERRNLTQPVAIRWVGGRWRELEMPRMRASAWLEDVVVFARAAWAVGGREPADGEGPTRTLALRFDGRRWHRARTPSFGNSSGLNAVDGRRPSQVFAVGAAGGPARPGGLILARRDGAWVTVRRFSRVSWLQDVLMAGPRDWWAVGYRHPDPGRWETLRPLVVRRHGSRWALSAPPAEPMAMGAVDGTSTNLWAVGHVPTSPETSESVLLHRC